MPVTEFLSPHILRTKLYRPPVSPDMEQRTRLLERLSRNRQRPLTLISAPAGYGKTIIASQWLETCNYPSAWLSIDESDNDLGIFVGYLLVAISSTFPDLQLKTLNVMAVPNLPPITMLGRMLINDLDQIHKPFILVIDDIHRIHRQEIYELFDILLQHPPRNLHLVMIGRHDPLLQISSLRARGQVTEIRSLDLCFTSEETARFMQKMLNREIDPAVAAEWTEATEGWVTALRLAALSLRHRGQDDDLSLRVRGDSRYLRDYLLAEVLTFLPRHYQDCLIKIAILDRFCGSLCEAICQTDAAPESQRLTGETFIDWLEGENLFLIPLDDQHQWFRFHHLFQELLLGILQEQSGADEIAAIRRRASDWFAANDLIDEALKYALHAGDLQSAVDLIGQHRYSLMNTDQWRRLDNWINLLPSEVVSQDALLMSTKAYIALHLGQDAEIISSMRRAEQILADLPHESEAYEIAQSEIDVIQLVLKLILGQPPEPIDWVERSLQRLPVNALQIRLLAFALKGVHLQIYGDLKAGVTVVRNALAGAAWPESLQAKMMHYLAIIYTQAGDLNGILASAQMGLEISEKIQSAETLSWCRYHLGVAHFLRNEFSQAEPILSAFLEEPVAAAPNYFAQGAFMLALIYDAQDRTGHADRIIHFLTDLFRETSAVLAANYTAAFRVELLLRRGKFTEARRLSKNVDFEFRFPVWLPYTPQLTLIKLLLAEGSHQSLAEARSRLNDLDEVMRRVNRVNVRIDVLALQTLVCNAQGDEPAALKNLETALTLGEVGGFIRSFIDLGPPMAKLLLRSKEQKTDREYAGYIEQILGAFPKNQLTEAGATHELLTDREYEVLSLLAKRLSYREIAEQLVISLPTVKSHTLNIYSKLGVNKRMQAVEKAVEVGILPKDRTVS